MRWYRERYVVFWERLTSFTEVRRNVGSREILFVIEHTREDAVHAATVDDLVRVMGRLPSDDLENLGVVLLRQPKRKEEMLAPVWGRLVYLMELPNYRGPGIVLEAYAKGMSWQWPRKLPPAMKAEIERLRSDGHDVEETGRWYRITPSLDAFRSTQLFRTLPHEVGHWAQYLAVVERHNKNASYDERSDRYDQIPDQEKEAFAHRYADDFVRRMRASGFMPFERIISAERLARDGLRKADFYLASDAD